MSQAPSGPQGQGKKPTVRARVSKGIQTVIDKIAGRGVEEKPALFHDVFEKELGEIETRRTEAGYIAAAGHARQNLVGLALSGGGIRSATVCLGALQALNKLNLLRIFDYLSTVSGGGFVGGWWSAWLSREKAVVPLSAQHIPDPCRPQLGYDQRTSELSFRGKMSEDLKNDLIAAHNDTDYRDAIEKLFRQSNDLFNGLFPIDELIEPQRSPDYVSDASLKEDVKEGSLSAGSDPIHHLRLYANYLTPRKGFLSGDTWLAAAIVSRNLVLTWLILLPLLFAAVMVGRLYYVAAPGQVHLRAAGHASFPAVTKFWQQPLAPDSSSSQSVVPSTTQPATQATTIPATQSATMPSTYPEAGSSNAQTTPSAAPLGSMYLAEINDRLPFAVALPSAMLALLALLTFLWLDTVRARGAKGKSMLLFVPVLLALFIFMALAVSTSDVPVGNDVFVRTAISFAIGFFGGWAALWVKYPRAFARRRDPDDEHVRRNLLIRSHVHILQLFVLISAILALAGFGHLFVDYVFSAGGRWLRAGGFATLASAIGGLIFTSVKGAPVSGGSIERSKPSLWAQIIFIVTPILVLVVLALLAAWLGHQLMEALASTHRVTAITFATINLMSAIIFTIFWWDQWTRLAFWARGMLALAILLGVLMLFAALRLQDLSFTTNFLRRLWLAFLVVEIVITSVAWVIALGGTADPNWLSLHGFYKVRLIRAYMGASNTQRGANRLDITESALNDDINHLCDLKNCQRGAPYHLINTTLNLVGGHDLTTAQRHAAYFTFSKHFCGSARTAYRDTQLYMDNGMSLGTAVAISGAAASPNMGAKTPSAALGMLMTLTNVRLGYWAPTPSRSAWTSPQARLWPYYTLREFLSQTNDLGQYCYLTDGGHFENTALYSLIERGCKYIILFDCGADPSPPCFADMGDALRRCRMDFGTEIDLDIDPFGKGKKKPATQHVIVGKITYSAAHLKKLGRDEDDDDGIIIWFKPMLSGDEPADVRQYAIENHNFPQQTTADQWFDEAQFESYRRLGEHIVTEAFASLRSAQVLKDAKTISAAQIKEFFEAV